MKKTRDFGDIRSALAKSQIAHLDDKVFLNLKTFELETDDESARIVQYIKDFVDRSHNVELDVTDEDTTCRFWVNNLAVLEFNEEIVTFINKRFMYKTIHDWIEKLYNNMIVPPGMIVDVTKEDEDEEYDYDSHDSYFDCRVELRRAMEILRDALIESETIISTYLMESDSTILWNNTFDKAFHVINVLFLYRLREHIRRAHNSPDFLILGFLTENSLQASPRLHVTTDLFATTFAKIESTYLDEAEKMAVIERLSHHFKALCETTLSNYNSNFS